MRNFTLIVAIACLMLLAASKMQQGLKCPDLDALACHIYILCPSILMEG